MPCSRRVGRRTPELMTPPRPRFCTGSPARPPVSARKKPKRRSDRSKETACLEFVLGGFQALRVHDRRAHELDAKILRQRLGDADGDVVVQLQQVLESLAIQ